MFDMKNLAQLKKLDENAPDQMKAFWAFDKAAFTPGSLDALQKQLMAVAVALTTQCPYCIELHLKCRAQSRRHRCHARRDCRSRRRHARRCRHHPRIAPLQGLTRKKAASQRKPPACKRVG